MGILRLTLLALVSTQSSAFFGNRKKQDDDFSASDNMGKATSVSGTASALVHFTCLLQIFDVVGFDATAALHEIRTNPEVQKKMRDMMKDPEALAELSQLMRDPTFKAQVEAFTANPEVAEQVKRQGAAAFLGSEARSPSQPASADDARARAAAKAEANLEYDKYSAQFTGEQNAATGLQSLVNAAKNPARLADAMADLNDPEMMKNAKEMMADPAFQAEMQRMMDQPEMRKIVEASRSFVQEISKDPSKMAEMQQRIAQIAGAGSPLDEF